MGDLGLCILRQQLCGSSGAGCVLYYGTLILTITINVVKCITNWLEGLGKWLSNGWFLNLCPLGDTLYKAKEYVHHFVMVFFQEDLKCCYKHRFFIVCLLVAATIWYCIDSLPLHWKLSTYVCYKRTISLGRYWGRGNVVKRQNEEQWWFLWVYVLYMGLFYDLHNKKPQSLPLIEQNEEATILVWLVSSFCKWCR